MTSPLSKIKFDMTPGKVALITGGSSGIGLATAKLLASSGMQVWLIARRQEQLDAALEEVNAVKQTADQHCGAISADLSDFDQSLNAAVQVEEEVGVPDLLINSAGVTHPGYVQELDIDIFRWMMEVNYFGTVNITRAILIGMLSRGSGYLVNISSMAGFIGAFGYTAYGASKYAIRGFSDAMRAELKPMGIGTSIVFPPDTDTPQLAYEEDLKPFETKYLAGIPNVRTAEEVAQAIIKGIKSGNYLIFPSFDTKLWFKISNIIGAGVYPIMDILINRAQRNNANSK